ncbi:MAG: phage holin family protein [Bacteroidota bacterium]
MTFTIPLEWIFEVLINGLAISIAAFLLPFVHVKNFLTAIVVGILISVVNYLIWWGLNSAGVSFAGSDQLARGLINIFIYAVSILIVDSFMKYFQVKGILMAAVFAVAVSIINLALSVFVSSLVSQGVFG